ncbi:MAG: ACT domain-containing protein [Pseudomonadales bacterium]|nr:ACT domain-containing protein [Pseudomonadales bacterium]
MAGEVDLDKLLALLQPKLLPGEFVFCSVPSAPFSELDRLSPLACYFEEEGMSLILKKQIAQTHGIKHTSVFRCITLSVHSSLDAVGFTAAVANKLAANGIPANVVAAFYHDHVFVPEERAEQALEFLTDFQKN